MGIMDIQSWGSDSFNESERFIPLLYNNLKGTIVGIEKESEEKSGLL